MLTEDKPADDVSRAIAKAQCQGTGRTIDTMEVIMTGRYLNRQAWKIASRGVGISRASRLERKIERHDRIFVDNADEENHANHADDAKFRLEDQQRQNSA